jgi:hypothetical protein
MDNIINLINSFKPQTLHDSARALPKNNILSRENIKLRTGILCFSKNRPFQLHTFLKSIKKYVEDDVHIIYVLYKSDNNLIQEYEAVFRQHPTVVSIFESTFSNDMRKICEKFSSLKMYSIMFCVDDSILVSSTSFKSFNTYLKGTNIDIHFNYFN